MNFNEAWDAFDLNDEVAVADGMPEPVVKTGLAWRAWRSHNFEGALIAKETANGWRGMRFRLPPLGGAVVEYTIMEGMGHQFSIPDAGG